MPRGATKDIAVTKLLRRNGLLLDSRSFVSLPRKDDGSVHLFLEGLDKAAQRPRVFAKHKRCAVCKNDRQIDLDWHHARNCDCVGCSELRCGQLRTGRACHAHGTSGFHRKAADYGR